MFGNITTRIPKTMPTVSDCACKMIVERMEKTGGKSSGTCLFNSPVLQAQIPIVYQHVDPSHSLPESPAKDQKLGRREEYPVAQRRLPLLLNACYSAPDTLW